MEKTVLAILLLLLGGCSAPVDDFQVSEEGNSATARESMTALQPATQADAAQASAERLFEFPVDAATLLASTLEQAKTDDKRVLIHLGAPT